MEEFELTYLAKYIPKDILKHPSKHIIDRYIPAEIEHPKIRLRKSGDKMEFTKKEPLSGSDSSHQMEQTIILTQEEYKTLAELPAKVVAKTRYYYPYQDSTFEIDVFEDDLKGLVLVDIEFISHGKKNEFVTPEFCLADVTQAKNTAGGILAGKKYENIREFLESLGYSPLYL